MRLSWISRHPARLAKVLICPHRMQYPMHASFTNARLDEILPMNRPPHFQRALRQALLLSLAFLSAGNAQAEWMPLGRNESFRIFLDQKLIEKSDGFVQAWQLMDFTVGQWMDARTVVGSIKSLVEYDCRQPRSRTLVSEAYSEQMGAGRKVANEQLLDPQWEDIAPGSTAEKIRIIACDKRR